ncbi:hypothetical protein L228DRAFT_239393 [Xylona heveae TC161]|uniref:Zn(2)-C6 fungal-type domain-containing protein n=1 Tax=Xylona heveae (strain CBS 132557 / TC161) TaxID=1328760 RepID=A0A165GP64_XYLHT|nr:hypothetical protein L228DRAFT_239393 [Xylona heveae TC161]KZF22426.1 hypothetical protein L228DRAFT_239393 [Xylona heveae TC161]
MALGSKQAAQHRASEYPPQQFDPPGYLTSSLGAGSIPSETCSISEPSVQGELYGKVAIPRVQRPNAESGSPHSSRLDERRRVSHACEPCRLRKTRCSGERPTCRHCKEFGLSCVYAGGKRDRAKRENEALVQQLEECKRLLAEMSTRLGEEDKFAIQEALGRDITPDNQSTYSSKRFKSEADDDESNGEEYEASVGAGSNQSLDRVEEDHNRSAATRATGYLGKNSEIRWTQRLKEHTMFNLPRDDVPDDANQNSTPSRMAEQAQAKQDHQTHHDVSISESTYHLDDMTILPTEQVDAYELPPIETAELLFKCFLDNVQFAHPFLGEHTFKSQFDKYLASLRSSEILQPGPKWLAILNLVFAIAAKYSHLVKAAWRGDERDHLIYFTRARMLAMDGDGLLSHPDLQQVQVAGLLAFYLITINQINRAYTMSGIAIRYCTTLGLNLRNEDSRISERSREIRCRVWWSVYGVERLLNVMTGRPSGISEIDCTAPLPLPVDEKSFPVSGELYTGNVASLYPGIVDPRSAEVALPTPSSRSQNTPQSVQSNPSSASWSPSRESVVPSRVLSASNALYHISCIQLSMLTREVLSRLYSAGISSLSWATVQKTMQDMHQKLQKWKSELPSEFDFMLADQKDVSFTRQRICLGFAYYSVVMITHRPCLCRIERRIPRESGQSKHFNNSAAQDCVNGAVRMMGLLPDDPDPSFIYRYAPWWCSLHHIMQAATILMLELAFRSDHIPGAAADLLSITKKAVQWLRAMSHDSLAAYRAWKICQGMLGKVAALVGGDVSDVPADSPAPGSQRVMEEQHKVGTNFDTSTSTPGPEEQVARQSDVDGMNQWLDTQGFPRRFPGEPFFGGPQPAAQGTPYYFPPIYTSYDTFLGPFQSSTSEPNSAVNAGPLFPSPEQMDNYGNFYNDGFVPQDPDWSIPEEPPTWNQKP